MKDNSHIHVSILLHRLELLQEISFNITFYNLTEEYWLIFTYKQVNRYEGTILGLAIINTNIYINNKHIISSHSGWKARAQPLHAIPNRIAIELVAYSCLVGMVCMSVSIYKVYTVLYVQYNIIPLGQLL